MVEVETRNAANTTGTTAVPGARRVRWQQTRNGLGRGEFYLPTESTLPAKGTIMRARCGARRFPWKVEHRDPVMVSIGEERREMAKVWGRGIHCEWDQSAVMMPPTLSNLAETDPVLDERVMGWMGPDFDHSAWPAANVIAVQGWPSTFYSGLPAGWWDGAALWVGPHSGDDDDAPPGTNLFAHWTLVGEGSCFLEYGGDNMVVAYVNGRRVGQGVDFRRKQTHEFTVTRSDPAKPVACVVRGRSIDGGETGRREILIPAGDQSQVGVRTEVTTSSRPVIGEVFGCTADVPTYLQADR